MINTGYVHIECAENRLAEFQAQPQPEYKAGDFIKTSFVTGDVDAEGTPSTEWMWVKITEVEAESLKGKLWNDPIYPTESIYLEADVSVRKDRVAQYGAQ